MVEFRVPVKEKKAVRRRVFNAWGTKKGRDTAVRIVDG